MVKTMFKKNGRGICVTPCPFGMIGKVTGNVLQVGSLGCVSCKQYRYDASEDDHDRAVICAGDEEFSHAGK